MNIAICEDYAPDAATARAILEDYIEQNAYSGEISVFGSGEELLADFSLAKYDVIFLDIYMEGMNGITAAKKIRDIDPTCALIFITASSDHALASYSVRGSAYVVKPIDGKKMWYALFTCREIFLRNARYIEIRTDRVDIKIPLIRIYHVESYNHYALFSTDEGEFKSRMTLDEAEQQLDGRPFYRCHQSYLINSNHIRKLDVNEIIMKNDKSIPIRKSGRDKIRQELASMLSARRFEV